MSWQIVMTICMLTLFFAFWSFINVIYYVQLAKMISRKNEESNNYHGDNPLKMTISPLIMTREYENDHNAENNI